MSGNIPLPSEGAKTGSRATATCYCSAVQLEFPTEGEDFVDSFICHCSDCRKITASMFASNFIVNDSALKHVRGKALLTKFAQAQTIQSGNTMENHFCSKCGTLMYRVSEGFMGKVIIDDFDLHETKVKPRIEQYAKNRVKWCSAAEGVEQHEGGFYWAPVREQ